MHEPDSEPKSRGSLSKEVLLIELQKRLYQKQEGIVVHNMSSNYGAGRRNAQAMFKIKKIEDVLAGPITKN